MRGRRPRFGTRQGRLRVVLVALTVLAGPAGAADDFEKLHGLIARHAPDGVVPEVAHLRALCADELRCAAEKVVEAWPDGARLMAVPEPDPALIRAGALPRSVTAVRRVRPGVLRIRLERFGWRADRQVLSALSGLAPGETLELDLRRHRGGSVARMLDVAGVFVGPRARALRIVSQRGAVVFGIPLPARRPDLARIDVLIGPETRSSAEVLAALLHRYAGARLVGERTSGKNWAEQPLRIGRGWYLMIRAGEIRIDGEVLEGGLEPDLPEQP